MLDASPARGRIDAALDRYAQYDSGCPPRLQEAIRHSLLAPGKRLRPLLVLMAAEACGSDSSAALPAACAVEMVHTYSLIHDDLPAMDDDDLRRGRPSCHAAFGEATAILAGDALLAQAFQTLAQDIRPLEVAARCCAELAVAAGAAALVGGQSDDLAEEERPPSLSPSDPLSSGIRIKEERPKEEQLAHLESIHRRKTGAMFRVSLRLGGIVVGADERQLSALTVYGEKMGLAFQIVDDLLDVAAGGPRGQDGNEQQLGKRTQKDFQRGKLTFPRLLGVPASRRRAAELVAEAQHAVRSPKSGTGPLGRQRPRLLPGPGRAQLEELAQFVLERNR